MDELRAFAATLGIDDLQPWDVGFVSNREPGVVVGARKGSPLAIGYGEGEMYLGSDAIALGPFTEVRRSSAAEHSIKPPVN